MRNLKTDVTRLENFSKQLVLRLTVLVQSQFAL
jgi:hypothetical protein